MQLRQQRPSRSRPEASGTKKHLDVAGAQRRVGRRQAVVVGAVHHAGMKRGEQLQLAPSRQELEDSACGRWRPAIIFAQRLLQCATPARQQRKGMIRHIQQVAWIIDERTLASPSRGNDFARRSR